MSVIAKILIVVNLLLAVVFLGAAATFLGEQESWKIRYDKQAKELNATIDTLKTNLDSAVADKAKAERDASDAKSQYDSLSHQFDQKDADYKKFVQALGDLQGKYAQLSASYNTLQQQLQDMTTAKDKAVQDKETAQTAQRKAIEDKNSAVKDRDRIQSQLEDVQGQLAELNKRMNDLAQQYDSAQILITAYKNRFGPLPDVINPPPLDASVSAVDNKLNIVLLSIGKDDKVKVGYAFSVYRGNEYVGKVIVDKVEKDYCSAHSVKGLEKKPIMVGDSATTRF
jgi:predicted nuclease with TOPRIM domain